VHTLWQSWSKCGAASQIIVVDQGGHTQGSVCYLLTHIDMTDRVRILDEGALLMSVAVACC